MVILVSEKERKLVEQIRRVGYGEIYGLKHSPDTPKDRMDVSAAMADAILALREAREISVLTIHQGEPAYAEIDFSDDGFRCRKKIKFPTV